MTKMSDALSLNEGFLSVTSNGLEKIISTVEQRVKDAIRKDPDKFLPRFYRDEGEDEYDFYTVRQTSEILRISESTVRSLCNEGTLIYSIPSKRTILISKKTIKNYLKSVTHGEE